MNNAGIIGAKGTSWDGLDNWKKIFDVNLFGYVTLLLERMALMILCIGLSTSSRLLCGPCCTRRIKP